MAEPNDFSHAIPHGAGKLPLVTVDSWNIQIKDGDGFLGDRASKGAFMRIADDWRKRVRKFGDPLGEDTTDSIGRGGLETALAEGSPEAAGLVLGAVEEFAQELATVVRRFLKTSEWKGTEKVVVGGGMRASRLGELAIGRAEILLRADGIGIDLHPIGNDPDEAGLMGAVHLAPAWIFAGHDAILAADIGGTNMRAGIVRFARVKGEARLKKVRVWKSELWRHADDKPTRKKAVSRLVAMFEDLIAAAGRKKLRLAPFIGVACPGIILEDGTIQSGGQNLPGNWEAKGFNLPQSLTDALPRIGDHDTTVVMHNDAVVQGLSELSAMAEVARWGVLTIGTGLGNARFSAVPKAE